MTLPHENIDPDGLLEYSVVFTDRSLNHMSARFIGVMQQLLADFRETYQAHSVAIVPGGGTYAMESVARQLATDKQVLVVRNGLFSFRWSQILQSGGITDQVQVAAARPVEDSAQPAYAPVPIAEVTEQIRTQRPAVVFAPHVETAAGLQLPADYLRELAAAVHEVDGLLVLDCIASGASWVSMADTRVDVLISAPQKGWSGTPCAGYVMLSEAAARAVKASQSTSFALDLAKWLSIAEEYRDGRAAYHATMPTDSLAHNAQLMQEAKTIGLERLREAQQELGTEVRKLLAAHGFRSVAADGFAAPSVVVSYTNDPAVRTGAAFKQAGLQVAAGVPLQVGEGEDFSSFRVGLFGLDKLTDVAGTVQRLAQGLERAGL